ncbi:energy transducer TonB [Pseudooceanicola sp. C21-150M6]|uniref:energy transducer TonB n=1 Tax=Pseudooceanicola sp. C21-150M6 TaxID=3434355 RepID=UPI003D7F198D
MHTGHIISGAGHLALFAWMIVGGFSLPEEPPVAVTDVDLVSLEEFQALTTADTAPGADTNIEELPQPAPASDAPELASAADSAPEQAPPPEAAAPQSDPAPEKPEIATPPAEVTDSTPEITPPTEDVAVLVPEKSDEAPRDIKRVAPRPVERPSPEATPDEVATPKSLPSPEPAEQKPPQEEEKAPEEATTKIVTEAEKGDGPPKSSKRPPSSRPVAVAEAPKEEAKPAPKPAEKPAEKTAEAPKVDPAQKSAINDALEKALAGSTSTSDSSTPPAGPSGPPLTTGEKDALRVAVSACWNTGSLSTDALRTSVVVGVEMNENATPRIETIRMISSSGGSNQAAQQAFEAARRAIIRCGAKGFGLPVDKFGQWRDIEMTFDPENMRIK